MKSILMLVFLMNFGVNAVAITNDLEAVSKQIAAVKESVGAQFIANFPEPAPYGLLAINPTFQELIPLVQSTWQEALNNLSKVAPDRESKLVLLHALLYLPPNEYLKCLNHLLDLYQEGQITRDEYLCLYLMSPREENKWFLSYNAKDPRMQKLFAKMRIIFADDDVIQRVIDLRNSRKVRFRDGMLRRENPALAKRKIPYLEDESPKGEK